MDYTMTDEELKDAGISREVFDNWYAVMQALWTASILFFRTLREDERFIPVNKENEIFIGSSFRIQAHMVNNAFVEAELLEDDKQLAVIRYEGNVNPICQCFFIIIKSKVKIDGIN